jgi:hypothetical protein
MKETSFVYHDKRFFPAFQAKIKQTRAKQGPDWASERHRGCSGARFLRFRGKSAGVLLFVLYASKELRKGWSRMDLNLLPDKIVWKAASSNDLITLNP